MENVRPEHLEKQNESRTSRKLTNRNTNSYSEIYIKKREKDALTGSFKDNNDQFNESLYKNNNLESLVNETQRKNYDGEYVDHSNPAYNSIDPSVCNYHLLSIQSNFNEAPKNQEKAINSSINHTNPNTYIKSNTQIPPTYPLGRRIPINDKPMNIQQSGIMQRLSNRSQNNSIELSQLSRRDKPRNIINNTPLDKSNNAHYRNLINRSKSVEKLRTNPRERNSNSKNSRQSKNKSISSIHSSDSHVMYTSVDMYLQRRHTETQQKLKKLKEEKINKEFEELRDRPQISKKSKMIVDRLITNKQNVFDRLTSKCDQRKKTENLYKIQEINNKNTSKPAINETSEKLQRTIDDLYLWHKNLSEKKEVISQKINMVG